MFVNIDKSRPSGRVAPMLERMSATTSGALNADRGEVRGPCNWKLVFHNIPSPALPVSSRTGVGASYQSGANDLFEVVSIVEHGEHAPNKRHAHGPACDESCPICTTLSQRAFLLLPHGRTCAQLQADYELLPLTLSPSIAHRGIQWLFAAERGLRRFNPQMRSISGTSPPAGLDIVARSISPLVARYDPGPYSPRESVPAAWDREYLRPSR